MEENLIGQQVPIAVIAAGLIEWLKKQSWFPFAGFDSAKLNRAFAAVVAVATGVGIHFAFDPMTEGGTLTISGLNWTTVLHSSWAAVQQFALQWLIYWTAIKPHQKETT